MADYITLNDYRFQITGDIIEKQVTPWTAQINPSGVDFKNYAPANVEEWRDFRGGLGKESEETRANRFWWSDGIETTKEGYVTLGPLVTTAGAFNAAPVKIIDFASATYAFGTSVGKKWNTSTSAWDTADSSALSAPTDAIVFKDSTAAYLVTCNGTGVRYSSDGASWSAIASAAGSKYLCAFDKRLIGINAAGTTLYYSPRDNVDGTWSSFTLAGDYSASMDLFDGKLLTNDEPAIYLLTDTGLYVVDFWTQTCYKIEIRFPMTSQALAGMYWNGSIYTATGSGIVQASSGVAQQWGIDLDEGLPASYQGYIYDMLGVSHWVLIAVSGGTYSSIFKRHEATGGWHQVCSSANNIRCLWHSPATLYSPGRLWFGDGTNIKYIQFPDKTHDVTKVSGYTYAASGNLYLPVLSRVSSLSKIALKLDALTKSVNSSERITPYYIVDDGISHTDADWDALTSWVDFPHPSSTFNSTGVSFHDLAIKLKFERGSTTTNTPILKALALWYLPKPETVTAWQFTVRALGRDAKEITDNLATARDKSILINFSPDGDLGISKYFVRIVTMPSKRWLQSFAAEREFNVTVSEVI